MLCRLSSHSLIDNIKRSFVCLTRLGAHLLLYTKRKQLQVVFSGATASRSSFLNTLIGHTIPLL